MKTILTVEDNDKNMKLARDVLQAKRYTTLEAVNGLDGVRLALAHKPDLVLMDIQLPDSTASRRLAASARMPTLRRFRFRRLHWQARQPQGVSVHGGMSVRRGCWRAGAGGPQDHGQR